MITNEREAWLLVAKKFELNEKNFICTTIQNYCGEVDVMLKQKMTQRILDAIHPCGLITSKLMADEDEDGGEFLHSRSQEARDFRVMVCLMYAAGWNDD